MKRVLVALALFAISAVGFGQKWSFVVAGDGRTDSKAAVPDPTGINTPVVTKLFAAIKAEHPKFMLWTGDLIHGVYDKKITMPNEQQYAAWKTAAKDLENVTILPVRGNHEMYGDTLGQIWLNVFKSELAAIPGLKYFTGEEGYSYSYVPKGGGVMVIAVDQFVNAHKVNLYEMEKALKDAKARKIKNVFVYAHEMAFTCCSHPDSDNLSKFPMERDRFLALLQRYGVHYFFAGHDHTYDWMEITNPAWPKSYVLNQVVAGTAGAPFYDDKGYFGDHGTFDLIRKEHKDRTYGYLLVEIDDHTGDVKVTFKEVRV